jgi:GT2 family glycosyltransferase
MTISVIIPNYNGAEYLKVCLDSLSRQTFSAFDIVVVDNGSSDDSCKMLNDFYKNVKLVELDKNYGFPTAVNVGIKSSTGSYFVLLNNDTEVEADWLQKLYDCISKDNRIFSCSSKMVRYNERNKIDDAGDGYTILGWAYKTGDGEDREKYSRNKNIFSSCAGAAIYNRDSFEKTGYFDENFFAYMEDVDIGYRAKIYGYKNLFCSDAVVYHIGSATSGSKFNSFKVKLAARNNIFVVYKNMPILQLLINLPFLCLGFLRKYLFFIKLGYGKEYAEGLNEGLNTLKNIEKVKFRWANVGNYIKIEYEMIISTIKYISYKLIKLLVGKEA